MALSMLCCQSCQHFDCAFVVAAAAAVVVCFLCFLLLLLLLMLFFVAFLQLLALSVHVSHTTHLIQRPCYQRRSPCQDPAGNRTTGRPPDYRGGF